MTDIFVSYAHEDHATVQRMVPLLEAEGFSVWWDHTIPPGRTWDEVIARGINEARCCIVVWSKSSVSSDWVKEEATMAKDGRKFMPVQIDAAEPPVGFRRIQAANLQGWTGDAKNAQWQLLVREARATVAAAREAGAGASAPPSRPSYASAATPAPRKSPPIALIGAVSAGALALLIIGVVFLRPSDPGSYVPGPPPAVAEVVDPAAPGADLTKGREGPAAAPASASIVGDWSGEFIRTYSGERSPLNITFNANGTTDQDAAYTIRGNRITFMLDGIHAMDGVIRGNRITGSWTYASLRGEFDISRGGAAAAPAPPPRRPPTATVAGVWNLRTLWSDGVVATAVFTLNSDGSFTTSQNGIGVWSQNGNEFTMRFTNGEARCVYYGTFNANSASGDAPESSQCFGGTFTMSR